MLYLSSWGRANYLLAGSGVLEDTMLYMWKWPVVIVLFVMAGRRAFDLSHSQSLKVNATATSECLHAILIYS